MFESSEKLLGRRMFRKIREMGLERYIEDVFIKKARNSSLIWGIFMYLGGAFGIIAGLYVIFGDSDMGMLSAIIFLALVGGGGIVIGSMMLFKSAPRKQDAYKEELAKRYGNYSTPLKEIGEKLLTEPIHVLEVSSKIFTVADWLVGFCKTQGAYFIRKSNIAAVIQSDDGTHIYGDDGSYYRAYFSKGLYSWEQAFMILGEDNPYLLTDGEPVVLDDGNIAPLEISPPKGVNNWEALIVKQFNKNKEEGRIADWAVGMLGDSDSHEEEDDE